MPHYDPHVHGSAENYIREHRPDRYHAIAEQVDLCMELSSRGCAGGECDEGSPCPRHDRVLEVVERYLRMRASARARKHRVVIAPRCALSNLDSSNAYRARHP